MAEIDITDMNVPGLNKTMGQVLNEIVTSPSENFVELMKIAGLDGTCDFRYCNFTGVELDDADVSGWDFTGTDLTEADLSKVRNIDQAIFTEETILNSTLLPEGVSPEQLLTK